MNNLTDRTAVGESGPAPVTTLYVPASHSLHFAPSDVAVYPTRHAQFVKASLFDGELVPAGHVEHTSAPFAAE